MGIYICPFCKSVVLPIVFSHATMWRCPVCEIYNHPPAWKRQPATEDQFILKEVEPRTIVHLTPEGMLSIDIRFLSHSERESVKALITEIASKTYVDAIDKIPMEDV